jgi:hypothetical protein
MLRLARLLSIPPWLEKAWQETHIEAPDTRPMLFAADEETMPAALEGLQGPPDLVC